ncbi:uncharacterized protein LOC107025298 [Solanum pennellii]|uniref:Uncharacterized protein LOC107025298 n=1 Tax=Solanum pennellii TaxID=28526 RepID=A0ABM1H7L2_SOLPN|nr:uncharacterized protein LOC107025298 [Solanum pennellii]
MLARKRGGTIILNVLQSTSNKGIFFSFVPFTSASNNDFKIPRSIVDDGTVDRREERARSIGESLTDGAAKAVETGLDVGEKAKESIDEAWDAAKETTNNIKDAMVNDANDEMKKGYKYPSTDNNNNKDEHIPDLRKRADGYDLRNTH